MENTRSSYSDKLKWNVRDLYATEDDYERDYEEVEKRLGEYAKFCGHILDDANSLYGLLTLDDEISRKIERIYIYSFIQNDEDTRKTKYQTLYERAVKLNEKCNEASSYIVPELLKSSFETVEKYIEEKKELVPYRRMLKELYRMKDHVLSDAEEKILSSLSGSFGTAEEAFSYLSDADLRFGEIDDEDGKPIEMNEKIYQKLIISPNRKVRKQAFERLLEVYGSFKNTYAKLLASEVGLNNKLATIRHYDSALDAALYVNQIPKGIIENLLTTVKKNTAPLTRYWAFKKELLGVDELHIYDTHASICKKVSKNYSFDEARKAIVDSLQILGKEYVSLLNRAFDEGWIDSIANDGKRNGAYCTKCYGVHPYVLLNFDGTFQSVSTLAHELGHALHDYYAMSNQSYQDHGYSIFVAEVASQVNEILLTRQQIVQSNDREEKLSLLDDLVRDFKTAVYRQTMFADFEVRIHELEKKGQPLTHEVLCDEYYKLNLEYYGENIVVDELIKYEWEHIPHFYMNFYVYQYATAYTAAIIIAQNILNGKDGARENYLEFLKLGVTKTPVESLKVAGVDMESEQVLSESFVYLDHLIDELEENMRC